ncbi:MAG: sulfite exporter TauE/SafE family protein [Clostridia bacterium]|nr:sulfite exporter TauE/SafE family protein [Clostridia bacterium]
MAFYLYILLGVIGGIPAGMGMGGGTLTIPLLLLFGTAQKTAQCANLFSFLPMGVATLKMHAEKGLVEKKGLAWIALPAVAISVPSAAIVAALSATFLRKVFGAFLVGLAAFSFLEGLRRKNKERL